MIQEPNGSLQEKIRDLEERLAESEQLVEAIRNGEVDAFAISNNNQSEVYTLQSGDYAYRVLVEEFSDGAINVTEEGLIVYTNTFFCQLLQMPYDQVVGSPIWELISDGDQEEFQRLFDIALTGKSRGEISLSVNGKITPVYISLTSLQPKLSTIGIVITDFTEKKKNEKIILQYQQELENRNIELLQRNGELASFAYIASHDLQEPLRKIQTFSNLILTSQAELLSQKGKDYFERILKAEKRMRRLIGDLLNYSRLNTSEIVFTETDLNFLLHEVLDENQEILQETGTKIIAGELPVVRIIPHQFMQLFSNLILNAVKFRKPEVNPVIQINAEKDELNWRIDFKDNGIGFDQRYSEKIFELFQRLHGKSEYEGTGIGLSICRKILHNHGGYISASGQAGLGATFSIFIPIDNVSA